MSEKPPRKKSSKKTKEKSETSSPRSQKSAGAPKETQEQTGCTRHGKPLTLYCDSREEPLCQECLSSYNSYTILPIEEAYRYRLAAVYNSLNTHLFSKRDHMMAQMQRLELRIEEMKRTKSSIERDMKSEFNAMNERLNSVYGGKVAVLSHDFNELQTDLGRINQIVEVVEKSSHNALEFLQKSPEIKDAVEIALAKPFKETIEISPEELPRELDQVRNITQKFSAVEELIRFKNEVIWKLMNDRVQEDATQRELAEWVRLTEKFEEELSRLQLACENCGVELEEQTVNANCSKGTLYGGRHYFTKKGFLNKDSKTPPERESDPSLKQLIGVRKELNKQFALKDTRNTGFVSTEDFRSILSNNFGFSDVQINTLVSKYDPSSSGELHYSRVEKDLSEIKSKEKLLKYCKKKDESKTGYVSQEVFKKALKKAGLSQESIPTDESGMVRYSAYSP